MSNVNDATIDVEDESVVSVDLSDAPELADALAPEAGEAEEGKQSAKGGVVEAPEPSQAAQAALQEAIATANKARDAAEATARAERQRADEAGRIVAAREAELRSSHETAEQRELDLLTSNLEGAQRDLEASQKESKDAMEAGDFALAVVANSKIAKAAAKVDRLENAKADIEAGKIRKPATEGRVEAAPQPQTQTTPFEWYVSQYAPEAQRWLRAHPDCVPPSVQVNGQTIVLGGDRVKNAQMMKGHYEADELGIPRDTPEYFAVIEKAITGRAPAAAAPAADPTIPAKPKPRQAAPSAPPSRETPSVNGGSNKRSVSLNAAQQEIAKLSWPDKTPQQAYALYARNLLELQAEDKIGRVSH